MTKQDYTIIILRWQNRILGKNQLVFATTKKAFEKAGSAKEFECALKLYSSKDCSGLPAIIPRENGESLWDWTGRALELEKSIMLLNAKKRP